MNRDARTALLLLAAVIPMLFPAGQTYAGRNNNNLESTGKCAKKCSKNDNYIVRVECYTRCIEDNPDNSRLYYLRGETYRKVFLFNSAISDFRKVVELEPENIEMYYTIASTAALAVRDRATGRTRLRARLQSAEQEIALLKEELEIKDGRWKRSRTRRRPHYTPPLRLRILELRAARGWPLDETASRFLLDVHTLQLWIGRIDEQGERALIRTQRT